MTDDWHDIPELDTTRANVARIWDVQLYGKDNFAADRDAAAAINEACKKAGAPDGAAVARETRAWLRRAVHVLAERGIEQFIDLGVGLPAARGNVHQFAQQVCEHARTVYVDNDAMVLAHGRALLADNRTIAIQGDLRDPEAILHDVELRKLLDLDRPVGVLLVAVLDLLPDENVIASLIAAIRAAVAPGSHLVISHTTSDNHPEAAAALAAEYARLGVNTPMVPRTGKDVERFLAGWQLVEPGLVSPAQWRPEADDEQAADTQWTYAGIGYLPPQQPARLGRDAAAGDRSGQCATRRPSAGGRLADVLPPRYTPSVDSGARRVCPGLRTLSRHLIHERNRHVDTAHR